MTKPWEEEWRAVSAAETGGMNELHWGEGQVSCFPWGHDQDDLAACKLAAEAPAMARLLLELEWDHAECNICGGRKKHEPGCRLEALFQRIGLRAR